jgi:subtilisin family serine protease
MGSGDRTLRLLRLLAACSLFAALASRVEAQPPLGPPRVLIKLTPQAVLAASRLPDFSPPEGLAELSQRLERLGIRDGRRTIRQRRAPVRDGVLFRRIGLDRWFTLRLPAGTADIAAVVRDLEQSPWIEHAEPVQFASKATTPNDPKYAQQWHHNNHGQGGGKPDADLDTPEAWNLTTGNPATVIAVIDGGFDLLHPDLAGNFVAGYDFLDGDPDPGNPNEFPHATAVSGVAAARGNNGVGVAGICWTCSIMPLRTQGAFDEVTDAIVFAVDNGAHVIDISLGSDSDVLQAMREALDYAAASGTVVVASAGNYYGHYPWLPASFPNVVSAGASNHSDVRSYFSAYGEHLDVVAPGEGVWTTYSNNTYGVFDGTSASSPVVAGLSALLLSRDPTLHAREVVHLLRLGAEDQVGTLAEDTPGWDQYMGFGRVNAQRSLALVNGPWLALDRPHYVCAGPLTVAVKDQAAGAAASVTLSGNLGGDVEVVLATPLTAGGYYEGSLPISWAGHAGPVVVGNGSLELQDGEVVTATRASLSATALADCVQKVCRSAFYRPVVRGDCDADGYADPGEVWSVAFPLFNGSTETLPGAVAVVTTSSPDLELLNATSAYGEVQGYLVGGSLPGDDGTDDPIRFRVRAGAASGSTATLSMTLSGAGWESDTSGCIADGHGPSWNVVLNRDRGSVLQQWTFPNPGNAQGFTHQAAHGTGDSSECTPTGNTWGDSWNTLPATDHFQSPPAAMRYGNGTSYPVHQDSGLVTPALNVPAAGGALGFYLWMDTAHDLLHSPLSWNGMILETQGVGEPNWSYLRNATYNADLRYFSCRVFSFDFPFGSSEVADVFAGDGVGSTLTGDTFDREHTADLTAFAGETMQVRFRMGADDPAPFTLAQQGPRTGVWIDNVTLYGPWVADAWPGVAPANLQGTQAGCPAGFGLSWNAVAGAGGYNVYRSALSCEDAAGQTAVYGTASSPAFTDTAIGAGTEYFYSIEATEQVKGCPTNRACLSGGCGCPPPAGVSNLRVAKNASDVLLVWDAPAHSGSAWNVYRDGQRDPSTWGPPHAGFVTDEDPAAASIQFTDAGALGSVSSFFYLTTAVNGCGESR